MAIKIIVLALFVLVSIGIGIYFNKKSKTVSDFVLGGRSLGPWITAFAFGTSYFSSVVFVGYSGQFGWKYGMAAVWIGLGNAFIGSLMAWVVMGRRTRVMTKHLESATMPEFFEKRYNSKTIKIIAALIVFIFLIPYTASVYNGLSRLFSNTFEIPYEACVAGMAIITAVYVILGGYMATAYNDLIQGIIMLAGIIMVIVLTLAGNGGLYASVIELSKIETTTGAMAGMSGGFTSFFGPDPTNLIGVVILTSIGTWGLPQMVHKFYTIRDEKSIKAGTVVSTVFAIVVAGGCYFLGGFGRLFVAQEANGMPVGGYDEIIPTMIQTLPEICIAIIIVLVLSASMSTLSSLVLTSSSTLTLDLIKPYFKGTKSENDKKSLVVMRAFIGVFLLISVIIALNKNALIADLMGYSWGVLAGSFLAPFLYGLFWKGVTKTAVYVSFIFGVTVPMLHMLIKPEWTIMGINLGSPVNLGAAVMLCGLIITPIVSLLTPKMSKLDITSIFSCYEHKIGVSHDSTLSGNK